jgi:hypothetical protein
MLLAYLMLLVEMFLLLSNRLLLRGMLGAPAARKVQLEDE